MSKPRIDHESIRSKLDHHDVMIGALDKRMEGVETRIDGMRSDVDHLRNDMGKGFANVERMIAAQTARQGLPWNEQVRVAVGGATLIALSSGAVTFLVTAIVSPDITKLKSEHARVETSVTRREQVEFAELQQLKKKESERAESLMSELRQAVDDLKVRVGWTKVEIRRP